MAWTCYINSHVCNLVLVGDFGPTTSPSIIGDGYRTIGVSWGGVHGSMLVANSSGPLENHASIGPLKSDGQPLDKVLGVRHRREGWKHVHWEDVVNTSRCLCNKIEDDGCEATWYFESAWEELLSDAGVCLAVLVYLSMLGIIRCS